MNTNPLRQYFRRPGVYLRLPSGGRGYPDGAISVTETGELPVYPMTAIDEITSKTPDALFNGTAICDIIKSCVPDIKDPWAVKNIDLDSILIAIRAASGNGTLDLESVCPACQKVGTYAVNLTNVLNTLKAGDYTKELDINSLKIKFKPLEYREMNQANIGQLEVQKIFNAAQLSEDTTEKTKLTEQALRLVTDLTMQLLSRSIDYIKTPDTIVQQTEFIYDFLKNCDNNVYVTIRDYNSQLRQNTELKPFDVTCVECSNQYQQPFTLNISDFFG